MKILITGAAGFIGHNLSLKLYKEHDIVCLDGMINDHPIYKQRRDDLLSKSIKFIELNLNDNLDNVFSEKFDIVVHLAAKAGVRESLLNPQVYLDNNVSAFVNLLEAMKDANCKKLIYASSSSVYGNADSLTLQEHYTTTNHESMYASTKKMNEIIAQTYHNLYNMESIGLRFFTVYGPFGRPDMAPFIFLEKITRNEEIELFNYGKQYRDFTYIDDVIQGIYSIIETNFAGCEVYNLGSNNPISLFDFVTILENTICIKARIKLSPRQQGDVDKTHADMGNFFNKFGFKPNTSFESGISQFVRWYINNQKGSTNESN
jgi:UDP-glucuronate 4-epimerase